MATTAVRLEVSYGQLAVFVSSLEHPFNDWTDQHVSQGFAWRPGSVSFRTLLEAGQHLVEINVVDHMSAVHHEAVRVVEVPFQVSTDGTVEVGSIAETVPLSLPTGLFLLRCELMQPQSLNARVQLTFARNDEPRFAVVRADNELSIDGELLTNAEPAPG